MMSYKAMQVALWGLEGGCMEVPRREGERVGGLCQRCHVDWGGCAGVQYGLGRECGDVKEGVQRCMNVR